MNENNYYTERQALYGITEEMNSVNILKFDAEKKDNVLQPHKIFVPTEKGIEIIPYTLERGHIMYGKNGSRHKTSTWSIVRLAEPYKDKKDNPVKYLIPKGTGSHPFFPPQLVDKFEKGEKIETLILTEGYYKAFKGAMHGLDIIGLTSITHFREKETSAMHEDIIKLIKKCTPKRVVWLVDGDCTNLTATLSSGKDLYMRPNLFFQSAYAIKRLLEDYDVEKVFAHICSDQHPDKPKGLDDLLNAMKGKEDEVITDFNAWSKNNKYFEKIDITYSTNKLRNYFHLNNVNDFISYHLEHGHSDLKNKEFIYHGTKYKWNDEKAIAEAIIPGDANLFFRVGDQYYRKIEVPNKYGQIENTFNRRQKSTIIDDYGKDFAKHIPKYNEFAVVPDHANYQEVIHACYNLYYPFEYEPEEGSCEVTLDFLKHIFGNKIIKWKDEKETKEINELDLGLDYLQLLYKNPTQVLPILCLVSKENHTGKTTFGKWLRILFSKNAAIVGNADLANDFNAGWASKLLIICDESKIDKQMVIERVKSLSTGDKIYMNAKGKDQVEIDFFGKFILISNHEDNFIYASEEDVRYWVKKVPVLAKTNNDILKIMKDEIPAFLHYLDKRKMATENRSRGWFHFNLIKTEALQKVIANTQPTIEKEIRQHIRDMFFNFPDIDEIKMTVENIKTEFLRGKNYEINYIHQVLQNRIKVHPIRSYVHEEKNYSSFDTIVQAFPDVAELELMAKTKVKNITVRYNYDRMEYNTYEHTHTRVTIKCGVGRPYVFRIKEFLTEEEIASRRDDTLDIHNDRKLIDKVPVQAEFSLEPNKDDDLPF